MDMQAAAARIHGCEYGQEGDPQFWAELKAAGLVAVYGASDDLTEFRGAIYDEAGAGEHTQHRLTQRGFLQSDCPEGDDCPYFKQAMQLVPANITARWCPPGFAGSWLIETTLPHATFDVMEDGELYCRGVVLRLADLPQ